MKSVNFKHRSLAERKHVVKRSNFINRSCHMIKRIDDSGDDFSKKTPVGWIVETWVVKCTHPQNVGLIEAAVIWQNYKAKR